MKARPQNTKSPSWVAAPENILAGCSLMSHQSACWLLCDKRARFAGGGFVTYHRRIQISFGILIYLNLAHLCSMTL